MDITRKRVHFGGVTTFVDPRSDLCLNEKERIFLHYLPDANGGTRNKNSLRYQIKQYRHSFYVSIRGFYNFEIAAKRYAEMIVQNGGKLREIKRIYNRNARRLPLRAKEMFEGVTEEVIAENRISVY